jgi:hypothetical protein
MGRAKNLKNIAGKLKFVAALREISRTGEQEKSREEEGRRRFAPLT